MSYFIPEIIESNKQLLEFFRQPLTNNKIKPL
jgi:hypothetical protein